MHRSVRCLVLLACLCRSAWALDGFENVQCGADVAKALIGQRLSDEPAVKTESRHTALGLKNLGGDEISEHLFSASWRICGNEFDLLLDDRSVIRDAVQFPPHSKTSPAFIGSCQLNQMPQGTIIAVLDDSVGSSMLAARVAWRIDEKSAKFVKLPADGLRCPREGIISADGGR